MSRVTFKNEQKKSISDISDGFSNQLKQTQQLSTRPSTTQAEFRIRTSQSSQRPSTQSNSLKMPQMKEFEFQTQQNFYKGGNINDEDEIQSQEEEQQQHKMQIDLNQTQQQVEQFRIIPKYIRKRANSNYDQKELKSFSQQLKDKLHQRKEAQSNQNKTHVKIKSLLNWKDESIIFSEKEKLNKSNNFKNSTSYLMDQYEKDTNLISSSKVYIDENVLKQKMKQTDFNSCKEKLKKFKLNQKYFNKECINILTNMLNLYVSNAAQLDKDIPDKLKNIMWKYQIKIFNADDLALQKLTQSKTYIPAQTVEDLNTTMIEQMRNIIALKSDDCIKRQNYHQRDEQYQCQKIFKPEPPSQRKKNLKFQIKDYSQHIQATVQQSHEIDQKIQSSILLNPLYNHNQQLDSEFQQFVKKLDLLNKFDI